MNNKKKYLIFAHYHSSGSLRDDILSFLKESEKHFKKIIFISTKINNEEIKKLSKNIKIIKRRNIGYDFYSYKSGLDYLNKKFKKNFNDTAFFFVNSSILFTDPKKLFRSINKIILKKNEFWGITRSLEMTDHIQSYFFFFSGHLFKLKNISSWWKKIKPLNKHYDVMLNYELGLSKLMLDNNVNIKSIYKKNIELKTNNFFKKIYQRFNEIFLKTPKYYKKDPTNYFWEDLYRFFGIIKIKVVKNFNKEHRIKRLCAILIKKNILNDALNN